MATTPAWLVAELKLAGRPYRYQEDKVDKMIGKFYMGADSLGTIGSSLTTYDDFNKAAADVSVTVGSTRRKRYIVQVIAVVEPEPPVPPTRTTVLNEYIARHHGEFAGGWHRQEAANGKD